MPDNELITAELDKIDAATATIRDLYAPEPPPDGLALIEEGSSSVRESLPPPLGEEVVVEAGEELNLSGQVSLYSLHIKPATAELPRGKVTLAPGTTLTIEEGPVSGPNGEFPGILNEGWLEADGGVPEPVLGESDRPIVIRSANPAGVRGAMRRFHHGVARLRGVFFDNLGRTLVGPFSETNLIGHYGGEHDHHCHAAEESWTEGCYFLNTEPGIKWASAIHQTSDHRFRLNVVAGFVGAGLSFEDAGECRNVVEGNIFADIPGDGTDPSGEFGIPHFGGVGAAAWDHGPGFNRLRNNRFIRCRFGYVSVPDPNRDFGYGKGKARLPKQPGGHVTVPGQYDTVSVTIPEALSASYYLGQEGNTFEDCYVGAEFWKIESLQTLLRDCTFRRCTLGMRTAFIHRAHAAGCLFGTPDAPCVEGVRMHSSPGQTAPSAYNHWLGLDGCTFHCSSLGIAGSYTKGCDLKGCEFHAPVGFRLNSFVQEFNRDYLFSGCTFDCDSWLEITETAFATFSGNPEIHTYLCPTRIVLTDCDGETFEVFLPEQHPSYVPPASSSKGFLGSPTPGATNADLEAEMGLPTFGYLMPEGAEDHPRLPGVKISRTVRQFQNFDLDPKGAGKRGVRTGDTVAFKLPILGAPAKVTWLTDGKTYLRAPQMDYGTTLQFSMSLPGPKRNFGFYFEGADGLRKYEHWGASV